MGAITDDDQGQEMPEQLRYLYDLFMGLRFNRIPNDDDTFSLMAKNDLSYSDIYHNSLLTGLELHKYEVDVIMSLNSIFDKYSN